MRSWKFWAFALAASTVWWVLQTQWLVPEDSLDPVILLGIGFGCIFASLGMMLVRRDWTGRALGIFGVFLGVGLLFMDSGLIRVGWRGRVDRAELNAIRSILLVAVILFDVNGPRWAWNYRRGTTPDREADA